MARGDAILQGTLHGYGIARRLEQVSGETITLNPGTVYASVVRLQQGKVDLGQLGTSENNPQAHGRRH
jgi:hypothetical protein